MSVQYTNKKEVGNHNVSVSGTVSDVRLQGLHCLLVKDVLCLATIISFLCTEGDGNRREVSVSVDEVIVSLICFSSRVTLDPLPGFQGKST